MTVGIIGRALVAVGLLLLLFAGFQLWGTGLTEARAQEALSGDFETRLLATRPKTTDARPVLAVEQTPVADGAAAEGPLSIVATREPGPAEIVPASFSTGDALAVVEIPAIGVTKTLVEGTTREALRSGPGHYPSTPLPGRPGNAAIAGHRTTHGAPFFDIDLLQPGDEIQVETIEGRFTYVVDGHDDGTGGQVGHVIVDPSEVGVIADHGDNRLTLTACHPKYSAKQRIIVSASLQQPLPAEEQPTGTPPLGPPEQAPVLAVSTGQTDPGRQPWQPPAAPAAANTPPTEQNPRAAASSEGPAHGDATIESLGWQPIYVGPTLAWAAFTTLVAAMGWGLGRAWRRWPAYAMAVPPFGLALFYCFANLERLIPAV